jgi:membrane-associated protease RseP (regulator of RpoE activity)
MGRGIIGGVGIALSLAATWAGGAEAQQLAARYCGGAEPVGSLGITGIKCERCRFITEDGDSRAVFFTEPTILALDPEKPSSRVLRDGDVIVAIGGEPITTTRGSARFSNLQAESTVDIRVRRDGRLLDLTVPTGSVCPSPAAAPKPDVVGQTIPDLAVPVPPVPPTETIRQGRAVEPVPQVEPVPEAFPEPPAPPTSVDVIDLPSRVSLGFGFQCSECTFSANRGGAGFWRFSEPPNIFVMPQSQSWREGLRSGDRILAIEGVPITTEQGGQRLAAIQPGDRVTWTVERQGETIRATTTATSRADEIPPEPHLAPDPSEGPLRFSGTVGSTSVEVRGGRVTVTESPDGRIVVIRTGDTEIRLVASPGRGRR